MLHLGKEELRGGYMESVLYAYPWLPEIGAAQSCVLAPVLHTRESLCSAGEGTAVLKQGGLSLQP